MPVQREQVVACDRVPELDELIATARDDAAAIGRKREPADSVGVAAEGEQLAARIGVEHVYGTIACRCGEVCAIGAESHRAGMIDVDCANALIVSSVPEADAACPGS